MKVTNWTEYEQDWTHQNGTVAKYRSWTSELFDYGVRDAAGRAVGGGAKIEHIGGDDRGFMIRTFATRDGKGFGAIANATIKVETIEAAKALAEKKLDAAQKRFASAAAKGDGRQFARKAG